VIAALDEEAKNGKRKSYYRSQSGNNRSQKVS